MKKLLTFLFGFMQTTILLAQLQITADVGSGNVTRNVNNGEEINVPPGIQQIKSFALQFRSLASTNKLIIDVQGATIANGTNEYNHAERNIAKTFTFNENIINKNITIKDHTLSSRNDSVLATFKFVQTPGGSGSESVIDTDSLHKSTVTLEPLGDFLAANILPNYEFTPLGLVIPETGSGSNREKKNRANSTHLFFDEFGNSLLGAIPQGISNRQYIVHVIYAGYADRQRDVRYSIKQKTGTFSSALNINNSGAIKNLPNSLQGSEEDVPFDQWKEDIFPLGIATDDITFEIIATTKADNGNPVKVVLETQTVKMSPVYHATIDVGLINSELKNSTYSLLDAPDGSTDKVVKEADRSPKGIVTVMATFYTSPIIIAEKIFNKKRKKSIPDYKLTGRSFFDDHSFFERIYPTLGVSISSKSFENLFFGLNWELARGLSVFGGGHWGRVNTFEMPNFIAGETLVTQAEFDFYNNTKWKVDWAYGVKLDVAIIANLFK